MFRQRLLTVMVLIPLVLFVLYFANLWFLEFVVLLFVIAGGWEWAKLVPIQWFVSQLIFIGCLLLVVYFSGFILQIWLYMGLVFWVAILLAVITYPASQNIWGYRWIVGGTCLLLLPLFANTVTAVYEYPQGKFLMVYLFGLVWATDIGAYLVGKRWGRHKLIPRVSPGKTIEGALGGLLLALLVATTGYLLFKPNFMLGWFMQAVATVLISMVGDLSISLLKRRCKLKDTGTVFPGHGGVLDRLDSLIAAAPFFYYGLTYI